MIAAVGSHSQVLVGVVLAPAVGRRIQEGKLLATVALQLKDPAAQVQAALREDVNIISTTKLFIYMIPNWGHKTNLRGYEKGYNEISSPTLTCLFFQAFL